MTVQEAKEFITKHYINSFLEWVRDYNTMDNKSLGNKYGMLKSKSIPEAKANIKCVTYFQTWIFSGYKTYKWNQLGIDTQTLRELENEKFLSNDHLYGRQARLDGRTDIFYISQAKAKEMLRQYKSQLLKCS